MTFFLTNSIMNSNLKYQTDKIESRVEGFQSWHTHLGGSSYDLGEIEFTASGIVKKIPQAINVALFRPYPWEAKNVMSIINSLESFVILLITIYVFIKVGILTFFRTITKNSFVIGALIFVLFFAFVVGFTSYNFGALSRFRIPLVSIYLFILLYVRINHNKEVVKY
jgi:hypothetical protein